MYESVQAMALKAERMHVNAKQAEPELQECVLAKQVAMLATFPRQRRGGSLQKIIHIISASSSRAGAHLQKNEPPLVN